MNLESRYLDLCHPLFEVFSSKVRIVGGFVRDALLNILSPDIDAAVALTPEELIDILESKKITYKPTGLPFGSLTAFIDDRSFQLTCLRKDVFCDGRHASVEFGVSWEIDAQRRDFTFNALYADQKGVIHDYVGGLEDLSEGIVRFIGDPSKRISEDFLRILRFFRMHCYYGRKAIESSLLDVLCSYRYGLKQLSTERMRDELFKILKAPSEQCLKTLHTMAEINLFEDIFPFDLIVHKSLDFKSLKGETLYQRLAILTSPDDLPSIAEALHLSRKEKKELGL